MRNLLRATIVTGVLLASGPARADDWSLRCRYEGGLEAFARYDAGGPAYEIYVSTSGSSDLGRGLRMPMNNLMTPDEIVFFTQGDSDVQVIFRVNKEDLKTTIEIGSQVSWDYQKFSGTCEAIDS